MVTFIALEISSILLIVLGYLMLRRNLKNKKTVPSPMKVVPILDPTEITKNMYPSKPAEFTSQIKSDTIKLAMEKEPLKTSVVSKKVADPKSTPQTSNQSVGDNQTQGRIRELEEKLIALNQKTQSQAREAIDVINDLIAENGSLKKQVREITGLESPVTVTASKTQETTEDKANLKKQIRQYVARISELEEDLLSAVTENNKRIPLPTNQVIVDLQKKNLNLTGENTTAQARIRELEANLFASTQEGLHEVAPGSGDTTLRKQLSESQGKIKELESHLSTLQQELVEEITESATTSSHIKGENTRLHNQLDEATEKISHLELHFTTLQQDFTNTFTQEGLSGSDTEHLHKQLTKARDDIKLLQTHLSSLQQELVEEITENATIASRIKGENTSLHTQLTDATEKITQLESHLITLQQDLTDTFTTEGSSQGSVDVSRLQTQLTQAREKIKSLEEHLITLQQEVVQEIAEHDAITSQIKEENNLLKAQISELQQGVVFNFDADTAGNEVAQNYAVAEFVISQLKAENKTMQEAVANCGIAEFVVSQLKKENDILEEQNLELQDEDSDETFKKYGDTSEALTEQAVTEFVASQLRSENELLKAQLQDSQDQVNHLKEKVSLVTSETTETPLSKTSTFGLENEKELRAENINLKMKLDQVQGRIRQMESNLYSLQQEHAKIVTQYETDLDQIKAENEHLKEDVDHSLINSLPMNRDADDILADQERELVTTKESLHQFSAHIEMLQRQLEERDLEIKQLENDISLIKRDTDRQLLEAAEIIDNIKKQNQQLVSNLPSEIPEEVARLKDEIVAVNQEQEEEGIVLQSLIDTLKLENQKLLAKITESETKSKESQEKANPPLWNDQVVKSLRKENEALKLQQQEFIKKQKFNYQMEEQQKLLEETETIILQMRAENKRLKEGLGREMKRVEQLEDRVKLAGQGSADDLEKERIRSQALQGEVEQLKGQLDESVTKMREFGKALDVDKSQFEIRFKESKLEAEKLRQEKQQQEDYYSVQQKANESGIRQVCEDFKRQMDEAMQVITELKAGNQAMQSQNFTLNETVKSLQADNDNLLQTRAGLDVDLRKVKELNETLIQKEDMIQYELTKNRAQATGLEKVCENFKQQLNELSTKLEEATSDNKLLKREKQEVESRVSNLQDENSLLHKKEKLSEYELQKNRSQLEGLESIVTDFRSRLKGIELLGEEVEK